MKKNSSALVVESPFQLLSAVEAIEYFGLKNYKIFIRLSNQYKNDNQLKLVVDKMNIKGVEFFYLSNSDFKSTFMLLFFLLKFFLFFCFCDKIYLGNFESRFLSLISKSWSKKVIYLDDGSKTLAIQSKFSFDRYYDWFTIYDFPAIKEQNIFKNEFVKLKSYIKNKMIFNDDVIFLGSKISEVGIVEEEKYVDLIKRIVDLSEGGRFFYYPHRGESKEKLAKLNCIYGIEVVNIDFPIEMICFYSSSLPSQVFSFYSTALMTMYKIYGVDIKCFKFDYSESEYKDAISIVYDYYENLFPVIYLK